MWRDALPEQQTSLIKTIECRLELPLRLAHNCSQQSMRELAANCRPDLRHLLAGTEPVEPRHERGIEARRDRQCWRRNRGNRARGGSLAPCFQHRLGHLLYEQRNTVGTLDDVLPNACR